MVSRYSNVLSRCFLNPCMVKFDLKTSMVFKILNAFSNKTKDFQACKWHFTQCLVTFDLNTNWRLTSILMILDYDYLICCIVHVDYLTTALDPGPLLCVLQILHLSCKINKHNQSTESTEMCIPSFCNKLYFIHAISWCHNVQI